MKQVVVSGVFDDLRCRQIRFLDEAARLGELRVALWSDAVAARFCRKPPKFPCAERRYLLEAIRYVKAVEEVADLPSPDFLPDLGNDRPWVWAMEVGETNEARRTFCAERGVDLKVVLPETLARIPARQNDAAPNPGRKKVIVTGCYDWFHSGHVRFFEEVSELGDLYVAVGNDANVRHLKGEGHPMFNQDERRYVVGAIRHVTQALITSGMGWMDAEPEIHQLKPDLYAVNEDGDKPEKQEFCQRHGIQYTVLKRIPKEGLPRRQSTDLRGF